MEVARTGANLKMFAEVGVRVWGACCALIWASVELKWSARAGLRGFLVAPAPQAGVRVKRLLGCFSGDFCPKLGPDCVGTISEDEGGLDGSKLDK